MSLEFEVATKTYPMCDRCARRNNSENCPPNLLKLARELIDLQADFANWSFRGSPQGELHRFAGYNQKLQKACDRFMEQSSTVTLPDQTSAELVMSEHITCGTMVGFDHCRTLTYDPNLKLVVTKG